MLSKKNIYMLPDMPSPNEDTIRHINVYMLQHNYYKVNDIAQLLQEIYFFFVTVVEKYHNLQNKNFGYPCYYAQKKLQN